MTFPYQLIDLTHTLESATPSWDGGCGFTQSVQLDYADCPGTYKFRVMHLHMNAGIGTHVDAPHHCFQDGKSIHELTLNELCKPCVVINVSDRSHEKYQVTTEDIYTFEATYGKIHRNSFVIIQTGWDKHWSNPPHYHNNHIFPSVSEEAAQTLLNRGAAGLGIDTLSPDCPARDFPVHHAFLGHGKILVENVTNLDIMPAIGGYVLAAPIKIRNGTEAPIRLIGMVKKEERP